MVNAHGRNHHLLKKKRIDVDDTMKMMFNLLLSSLTGSVFELYGDSAVYGRLWRGGDSNDSHQSDNGNKRDGSDSTAMIVGLGFNTRPKDPHCAADGKERAVCSSFPAFSYVSWNMVSRASMSFF